MLPSKVCMEYNNFANHWFNALGQWSSVRGNSQRGLFPIHLSITSELHIVWLSFFFGGGDSKKYCFLFILSCLLLQISLYYNGLFQGSVFGYSLYELIIAYGSRCHFYHDDVHIYILKSAICKVCTQPYIQHLYLNVLF